MLPILYINVRVCIYYKHMHLVPVVVDISECLISIDCICMHFGEVRTLFLNSFAVTMFSSTQEEHLFISTLVMIIKEARRLYLFSLVEHLSC